MSAWAATFAVVFDMAKRTKILTMSAALVALMVVMMYLGSLVEVLDLVTLFVASLLLVFSVIEFGGGWPWMIYAATAVLSVLLLPNKFCAWEFALIVGVLPMLKNYFEKLPRAACAVLKFVSFNLLFAATLALFYLLLGMQPEPIDLKLFVIPAYVAPAVLVALGNLCFYLYDTLLTRIITLYYQKYRDRVRRWLRL